MVKVSINSERSRSFERAPAQVKIDFNCASDGEALDQGVQSNGSLRSKKLRRGSTFNAWRKNLVFRSETQSTIHHEDHEVFG
jgi:hypothetical protein